MTYLTFLLLVLIPPIALMLSVHQRNRQVDAKVFALQLRPPVHTQH